MSLCLGYKVDVITILEITVRLQRSKSPSLFALSPFLSLRLVPAGGGVWIQVHPALICHAHWSQTNPSHFPGSFPHSGCLSCLVRKTCSFCLCFFPSMQSALFLFLLCLSLIRQTCANYKSLVLQRSPLQGELTLHSWSSESGSCARGFSVLPKSIVGFSARSHSSCSSPDHTRRPAETSPGETHEFAGYRALTGCSGARPLGSARGSEASGVKQD